jgi:site-specific DNA recombinase
MKAALYCRVSTIDKGQTLDQQLKPLQDYCQAQGWEYETFQDFASGSKESRPQLDIMMQRIRQKEFQAVLVLRLDRLGRSLQHLLQLVQEFKNLKIRFISVTQGFDTDTAQGMFFLQVIGAVAEFERQLIRERINDKLKVLKAQGKRLGRPPGSKDKKQRKKGGYYLRYAK